MNITGGGFFSICRRQEYGGQW